jgi:hypothetical protein
MIRRQMEEWKMPEAHESVETNKQEVEDDRLKREEKKKKARLRTRGPYRKSHIVW